LKADAVTNTEFQHLRVRSHFSKEVQACDDLVVEINQFRLGRAVNVDLHVMSLGVGSILDATTR
jgi:hypothetical protein